MSAVVPTTARDTHQPLTETEITTLLALYTEGRITLLLLRKLLGLPALDPIGGDPCAD